MSRFRTPFAAWLLAAGLSLLAPGKAEAQLGGGFGNQAVGGISVDAQGIIGNLDPKALESLAAERQKALADLADGGPSDLRKVSLARIIAAVEGSIAGKAPLPADVLFLGGLERITHVFVDPTNHDIVLAGPADRISVDARGNVVGAKNRRPLLHLEDLLVALRAIDGVRQGGILCSIDPTPEGITRLNTFLSKQRTIGTDAARVFRGMEEALGSQVVTVGGVPGDSRMARVFVAADYRMKRIGMGSMSRAWPAFRATSRWCHPAGGRRRCPGSGSRPSTTRSPAIPTSWPGRSTAGG